MSWPRFCLRQLLLSLYFQLYLFVRVRFGLNVFVFVFVVDDVVCHMSQPRLWLDSGLAVSYPGIFWSAFLANSNSSWSARTSYDRFLFVCFYLLYYLRLISFAIQLFQLIPGNILICLSSNLKLQLISQLVQLVTDSSLCDFKLLSALLS